ncbi:hypothetical protein [Streptomyces sp. NBC_00063]|uniref:hypothetical protein n=1 Tax=Streptomyces sp. NBC_00063 TaxID=2975638 RepID=UPI002251522F|nr:hypothetical protein [Streptomyces sp. NBC_00063]MCX5435558.1 hypothetical protein [Streptomyces sp. NBC_00063]
MNVPDLLRSLALDPADLKPAPRRPANAQDAAERLGPEPLPCAACGTPARSTRIVDTLSHGRRWLDLCRDCMLATADRTRPTAPIAATLDVLRDAAEEAGVTARVLVDPPKGRHRVQVMANLERYRVTLTTGGAVVMQGSWSIRETGERKFRSWIGSYGSMPGARVTLAEQSADETWTELKAWPDSAA